MADHESYVLQSWPKYFRQTLVFGKSLISIFQEFFAIIDKVLVLGGRLNTRL